MTTNSTTAEDRLAELGIHLADAPTPFEAYVPAVQTGNLLFLSGMVATSGHTATVRTFSTSQRLAVLHDNHPFVNSLGE